MQSHSIIGTALNGHRGHNKVYYSGSYQGSVFHVGNGLDYATFQAAFDAEVVGKTYASEAALIGTLQTTANSELVVGTGTSFTTQVTPDSFILIGTEYHCVRDVQDDNNLRLWHGAPVSASGQSGNIKTPTKVTIVLHDSHNEVTGKEMPSGVDLLVVGFEQSVQWSGRNGSNIAYREQSSLRIENLTVDLDSSITLGLFYNFNVSKGRGVFSIQNCKMDNDPLALLGFGYFSSVTIKNITGNHWKANFQSDYFHLDKVSSSNSKDIDVMLIGHPTSYPTTSGAYDIDINRYMIVKPEGSDTSTNGHNGGFEINASTAGKVCNLTNSHLVTYNASSGLGKSAPILINPNLTLNISDTVLHSDGTNDEIWARGGTVNQLSGVSKIGGGAIRIKAV